MTFLHKIAHKCPNLSKIYLKFNTRSVHRFLSSNDLLFICVYDIIKPSQGELSQALVIGKFMGVR